MLGSLRTHSGVASDMANIEWRVALHRSYHAVCLATVSSMDTSARGTAARPDT